MPNKNENIKAIINGLECYRLICNIGSITSYILDNNACNNKIMINNIFVNLLNSLFNMTVPDTRGIIDEAELETLLKTVGNTVIEETRFNDVNVFIDFEITRRKENEKYFKQINKYKDSISNSINGCINTYDIRV